MNELKEKGEEDGINEKILEVEQTLLEYEWENEVLKDKERKRKSKEKRNTNKSSKKNKSKEIQQGGQKLYKR